MSYFVNTWGLLVRSFVFVALTAVLGVANAQSNGCGTGWNASLVPDSVSVLQCTFLDACNAHDRCYAVCDRRKDGECAYQECRPGGSLVGSKVCTEDPQYVGLLFKAQQRRSSCDQALYTDIRQLNTGKSICEAIAVVYRYAVKNWGDSAFNGYGLGYQPPAWKQSQEEYNNAIRTFLGAASAEQLQSFVKSFDEKKPPVNLCGRLAVSPSGNLMNIEGDEKYACPPHQ
jgi:hypothetical protein